MKIRKGLVSEMEQQENFHQNRKSQNALRSTSANVPYSSVRNLTSSSVPMPAITSDGESDCTGTTSLDESFSPDICRIKKESMRQEQPKKRWLREACQDQSLWGDSNELAQPIKWSDREEFYDSPTYTELSPVGKNTDANLLRPTVLMLAVKGPGTVSDDRYSIWQAPVSPKDDNLKWMGAMALMQLAKVKENDSKDGDCVGPLNLSQPRYMQL